MAHRAHTQSTEATAEMDASSGGVRREPGLVIITGSSLGEFYSLNDGATLIVGRDSSCDIVLQRPSVSRRHLRVERQGNEVRASDLGSKNGVAVDNQLVHEEGVTLSNGDLIRVGDATLKYLDGQTPETRYHERSYHLATRDALTNLSNRLLFKESLGRMLADWTRRGGCLSLGLLDLDRFKQVNDNHGHEAGDRVLQLLASILTTELRASDLIARLGGEEFAVAFADTDTATAASTIGKINAALVEKCQTYTGFPSSSFSAGIAGLPETLTDIPAASLDLVVLQKSLMHAADQAMYQAKDAGRNRVIIADPIDLSRCV